MPIEHGIAGPGMLADTIVRRWQDHQPVNRLEGIYAREGLQVAKSTLCGWHEKVAELVRPLVEAMRDDAFKQPYLCVDATGVLVLAKERCRSGDFWVTVAPDRHVLFAYSKRHDSAAVDELLGGYAGYLVADAHAVYDHATVLVCSAVAPPLFAFLFLWSTRPEPIPNGAPPSATSRSPFAWTAIVLGSVMVALGVLNQLIRSSRMKIDLTLREGNGGFVVIGAVVASIGFLRVNRRR